MKNLNVGNRYFDTEEISFFELKSKALVAHYRNSYRTSTVKFDSHEEAMLEYILLPEELKKNKMKK
jgi:hypothetical protein